MKMLLTVGDRELPIAMPSLLEELVVHLKIRGSQANLQQLHDGFNMQGRPFHQCVITMELISDHSQGFVKSNIGEKSDVKASKGN
jgi:hypothetical protein